MLASTFPLLIPLLPHNLIDYISERSTLLGTFGLIMISTVIVVVYVVLRGSHFHPRAAAISPANV